jgi:phage-related protein
VTTHKIEILITGRDKASGPISGVKGALGGIGVVAGGILAAGVFQGIAQGFMNMAAGAATFVKDSVGSAARVEEMAAVLKTLEANQGLAIGTTDRMVDSIKDLGITTQSAQWVTAQFTRWQLDSADATKLARLAQDAAVISMQDSSDALKGLMHGITTMNTRVLRTYGITLASTVSAQDEYAESLGKTRAELNETEKIQAVLNAVLGQGTQIQGAYEAAMDTAGKKARSMKRHVVELMNAVGEPFLNAFGNVVDIFTDFLKSMRYISEEGGILNDFLLSIGGVVDELFAAFNQADIGLDTFGDHIANVLAPITDFLERLKTFLQLVRIFGPESASAALGLEALFGPKIAGFIGQAIILFGQIKTAIQPVWDAVKNLFAAFIESGPQAQAEMGTFADWLLENLIPTITVLAGNVATILNNMAEFWREHGATIMAVLRVAFQTIIAIVTSVWEVITGIFSVFSSILVGDWSAVWATIQSVIENIAQKILTIMGTSLEELRATWAENFRMMLMIIIGLGFKIYNAGRNLVQGLWKGIKSVWSRMVSWIKSKVDGILAIFGDILKLGSPSRTMEQYGRWMMEGLAKGIDGAAMKPELAMAGSVPGLMGAASGATGSGGRGPVYLTINVDGARDPRAVVDEIMRRLRRQGVTLGQ